jgi:hypothetical protein
LEPKGFGATRSGVYNSRHVRPEIPPHIEAFILRQLPSLDHLAVLLRIREYRGRWFDAETLGSALGVATPRVEKVLEELCSGSLLAVQVASCVRYQFNPATPDLDALVTEFIGVLRSSRAWVYTLIGSPAQG